MVTKLKNDPETFPYPYTFEVELNLRELYETYGEGKML